MPETPTKRYKFVLGIGDTDQETLLNQAADDEGYRVISMVFDPSGGQVIVLMEKET